MEIFMNQCDLTYFDANSLDIEWLVSVQNCPEYRQGHSKLNQCFSSRDAQLPRMQLKLHSITTGPPSMKTTCDLKVIYYIHGLNP